jgi:3-oxoacyl-[acyl-carrier protein] reductase
MLKRRVRVVAGMTIGAVRKVIAKLRETAQTDRMLTLVSHSAPGMQSSSLAGKRVLVTGSTRGIGRALAAAFVHHGAHVVVHGHRESAAREVALNLSRELNRERNKKHGEADTHGSVVGIGADLAEVGAGRALVERAVRELGGLDLVINNAAIHDPKRKPLWLTSTAEMHRLMNVNVLAPFDVCAAAMASMLAQGNAGRIINLSTGAANPANVSNSGIASYGISKIALEGLSSYLAAEADSVTVITLRPDAVSTDMVEPLFPIERRWRMLPPESMVGPVLHLATAPRSDVHGRVFEQLELMRELAREAPPPPEAAPERESHVHGIASTSGHDDARSSHVHVRARRRRVGRAGA